MAIFAYYLPDISRVGFSPFPNVFKAKTLGGKKRSLYICKYGSFRSEYLASGDRRSPPIVGLLEVSVRCVPPTNPYGKVYDKIDTLRASDIIYYFKQSLLRSLRRRWSDL